MRHAAFLPASLGKYWFVDQHIFGTGSSARRKVFAER
jgi:hypothetical protein